MKCVRTGSAQNFVEEKQRMKKMTYNCAAGSGSEEL